MGNFISWLEDNLPSPNTSNSGGARGTQPQSLSGMLYKRILHKCDAGLTILRHGFDSRSRAHIVGSLPRRFPCLS